MASCEERRDGPLPVFFVSVASKEFSFPVNLLESTLMGLLVSVADKGLRGVPKRRDAQTFRSGTRDPNSAPKHRESWEGPLPPWFL